MTPEERVRGLAVSERLAGLSLEDLRALVPEEKAALLQVAKRSITRNLTLHSIRRVRN